HAAVPSPGLRAAGRGWSASRPTQPGFLEAFKLCASREYGGGGWPATLAGPCRLGPAAAALLPWSRPAVRAAHAGCGRRAREALSLHPRRPSGRRVQRRTAAPPPVGSAVPGVRGGRVAAAYAQASRAPSRGRPFPFLGDGPIGR